MIILKIDDYRIVHAMKDGKVFVFPTDTLYGLGCNARNRKAVIRIRHIKRTNHPFSVITTKNWIKKHLEIKFPEYLEKLPGPYTFIFRSEGRHLPREVSFSNKLGVRIPNHPVSKLIEKAGIPFISTSCNLTGENPITRIKDLPKEISEKVDFAIDGGVLKGKASQVWDLTGEKPVLVRK